MYTFYLSVIKLVQIKKNFLPIAHSIIRHSRLVDSATKVPRKRPISSLSINSECRRHSWELSRAFPI